MIRRRGFRFAGRRPKATLLGFVLLLPLLLAWADSWEGLREASRTITSVEARFVQKKTLPILAKPFVSSGRFTFQKPGSLRWEYDRPVRSVLLMHAGSVKRYLREGNTWREEAGASLTAMQTVMEEILNWQQGRFDANPHFQASLEKGPETRIILVPKDPSWQKMIRRIELTLSREQAGVMKSVRVVEDERSFTVLEFDQVRLNRPLPASLFEKVE
ncbi:MAG: outer membrane lipoprotein carrier protein LolA [Syntrophales bacterium]